MNRSHFGKLYSQPKRRSGKPIRTVKRASKRVRKAWPKRRV